MQKVADFFKTFSKNKKVIVIDQVYQQDKTTIPYTKFVFVDKILNESNIYFLDLNQIIMTDAFYNLGIVKWDSGHLTKLGHDYLADHYEVPVEKFLKTK